MVPATHGRWVRSIRMVVSGDHVLKELIRIHTMRGVVRTGIYTARLSVLRAEVAGRGFLARHHRSLAGRAWIIDRHFERMQRDVAVGAVFRTQTAADAPVFDDDFERLLAA